VIGIAKIINTGVLSPKNGGCGKTRRTHLPPPIKVLYWVVPISSKKIGYSNENE